MDVKTYGSPAAFLAALEARVRSVAKDQARPLNRVRTLLVMERFLARIVTVFPESAMLKGGLALELRLERARTTKDIDLRLLGSPDDAAGLLARAAAVVTVPDDFLRFVVEADPEHPTIDGDGIVYEGFRFNVTATVAARRYADPFGVDVAYGDVVHGSPVELIGSDLFSFIGLEPVRVPAYPASSHLAEKLHAYTLPRKHPNSRVKDLADMALIATLGEHRADDLAAAIQETFAFRGTHDVPTALPVPDGAIAQQAGVSRGVVGAYRRKHRIPAYEGYLFKPGHAPLTGQHVDASERQEAPGTAETTTRARTSRIDTFADLVGVESDASVAAKAGVTRAAVTAWRTRRGIPRAEATAKEAPVTRPQEPVPVPVPKERGAPAADSRLAAFADQMGRVSDSEVAALAGATREAVGIYRRTRGIPAWQGFRSKPRRSAAAKTEEPAPPAPPVVRRLVAYSIVASANRVVREFIAVGENIAIACERAQEGFEARDDGPWHVDLIKLLGDAFA